LINGNRTIITRKRNAMMGIETRIWRGLLILALLGVCCAGRPPRDDLSGASPEAYVEAGRELLREGRTAEAAHRFRSALALDGNHVPAIEGLGLAALKEGLLTDAESYFRQGMRMDPGYAGLYVALGRLEAVRGEPQAAISHYLRAIEMDNGLAEGHYYLARAYEEAGRYSLAEEYYKKTLDRDPNHSGAREDWRSLADRRAPPDEMPAEYYLIVKKPVISRGDLAALLARQLPIDTLCEQKSGSVRADDITGHWAARQIRQVIDCGLMTVGKDTLFLPRKVISRRDCAHIAGGIIIDFGGESLTGPETGTTGDVFTDVPADDPDVEVIRTVVSLGIMELGEDGSFRPDREVNGYRANAIVQALRSILSP
jgi:Tfp pilus assembly protein PilF